ncbi:type II secretion system GspH family protein [Patescibacteria group bacterium]|nr:type II secretion system GspH family protein [Patescibacteria group bacterium]
MLKNSRLRAFTLVELLIVITIIGILAAALLPKIMVGPGNARDSKRVADLSQISTALEFYADDHAGKYPDAVDTGACVSSAAMIAVLADYMSTIPADPQSTASKGCANGYGYYDVSGSTSYILTAGLETTTKSDAGYYEKSTFVVDVAKDYQGNIVANIGRLCSAGDCKTNGTLYVIGR